MIKTRRPSFAEGSTSERTPASACVRAVEAYRLVAEKADLILHELDNLTLPGVKTSLPDNDSLVIALNEFCDDD